MSVRRQGDIFFVECDEIPRDAEKQKHGIIARGETTGHTHRISAGSQAALFVAANVMYLQALKETVIAHDEHHAITLPAGDYKINRQREYTPDGWRTVAD